jgi:PPE-repeat protein
MIEASSAWQRLGTELQNAATTQASVLSSLTGAWTGPSSLAMAQAVEPYLTWLRSTAQQAQQTAASAQAAAAAFDSVRSAVILPAQVSANRTRLAKLLATNMFGINLPAIAETEDQYQGMWANNSAAMSRYHAASAQAATLPQLSSPPSIANPAGVATQASVVPAATTSAITSGTSAATSPVQSILSAIQSFDPNSGWSGFVNTWANQIIAGGLPINLLSYLAQFSAAQSLQNLGGDIGQGLSEGEAALGAGPGALGALGSAGLSAEPTAAIGVGVSLGKLTLPPAVVGMLAASHAPVELASAVSPLPAEESGLPFMPPLMPPPISAGSGWRTRKQQKLGAYEEPEHEHEDYEEYEEYEAPREGLGLSSPDSPGSGWRKREKDYDDIEYGAELPGTVIQKPPSAG